MHITREEFHTITFRRWEAAQLCNEMAALIAEAQADVEAYPALNTLFGAIEHLSGIDLGVTVTEEEDIEPTGASPDVGEEEASCQ